MQKISFQLGIFLSSKQNKVFRRQEKGGGSRVQHSKHGALSPGSLGPHPLTATGTYCTGDNGEERTVLPLLPNHTWAAEYTFPATRQILKWL